MLSNGWYWVDSIDYKFSSSGAMVGVWVDVPCYSQYPELPTGCESVALTNLLNYYGFRLGKILLRTITYPREVAATLLPRLMATLGVAAGASWVALPLRLPLLAIIISVLLEVLSRQKMSPSHQLHQ